MTQLSFIGLSYYTDASSNPFVNVIFQADTSNNSYEYSFTNSSLPTTWLSVPNISATIPANTPIFASLPYDVVQQYVWIRISGDNSSAIFQIFNTSDYVNIITTNTFMNNYSNISSINTTWGRYADLENNNITSNIYHTSQALAIDIAGTYEGPNPLYIMSQTSVTVNNVTNNGNIVIIGSGINEEVAGIIIDISANLINSGSGTLTLNGMASNIGIIINGNSNYNGAITLNGTGINNSGILIQGLVTSSGNVSLNGTSYDTYGTGIAIIESYNVPTLVHSNVGTLNLNGTANSMGISTGELNYSGAITLTGNSTVGKGIGIFGYLTQTDLGTLTLNSSSIDFNTSNINIYFNENSHGVLRVLPGTVIDNSFTFGISPTSNLKRQTVYSNIIENIPYANITNSTSSGNTITGTFGIDAIPWTATNTSNNWALATDGACLLAGTFILTPSGYVLIETIHQDDEVVTADNRVVKVLSTYHTLTRSDSELFVIKQHSVDTNSPSHDLYLSSGHLVKIHDKYMHPVHYKSSLIEKCEGMRELSFYHLELENFKTDFLRANNLEVESYRNDNIHHTKWDCSGDECKMVL